MSNYVSHGRYTRAQYDRLAQKDPNCIYLITDEGQIILGTTSYGYYAKNVQAVKSVTYSGGVLTVSWVNGDADTTYNIYDFTVGDGLSLGDAVNGVKTIDIKLDGTTLAKGPSGLKANISIKKLETASGDDVAVSYQLQDGSGNALGATIDIAKDQHLKNVELVKLTEAIEGVGAVNDDVLKFTWFIYDDTSKKIIEKTTYINVADFLREAEAGNGIQITSGKYSIKIDSDSEGYLTVGEGGLKLSGLNAALAEAKTEVEAKAEGHVKVTVTKQTDNHDKIVVTENDIASAALLGTASDTATKTGEGTYTGSTAFAKINAEESRAKDVEAALVDLLTWKEVTA